MFHKKLGKVVPQGEFTFYKNKCKLAYYLTRQGLIPENLQKLNFKKCGVQDFL
jgi:hypothetical protein